MTKLAINAGSIVASLDLNTGQFSTKLEKAQKQADGFAEKLKGYGGAFEELGKGLTLGVTAPLTAIGVAAGKIGMDFEAGMSRVQAISGTTKDEMSKLSEQALQLGADTAFSASEVASGMENLASAGFNANEIMEAMPGLLDLAAVSGGDIAQSSEVAASALRGFGLEAGEAGHVADVFARAAADTNAETADMGEAMKYIAPVAHAMGLSLEETAAAIGIMSDAGVKGSQAGTTLRGALSRLAKPTKAMNEVMDDLGISFYDSEGKMVSLKDQIAILQDATKGMTQEQKNQMLVTLYGQESLSGMLALVDAGPEKLDTLTTSLEESNGAAAKMSDTMMDNTKGKWEEMMGALETAGIKVFNVIAPAITKIAEKVGELADKFSNLNPKTQETIVKMAGIAAAIGPVLVVGGKMANGIGSIIGLFSKFGAGANIATTAASALGGASGLGSVITTGTEAGGVIASLGGAAGSGGILGSLTSGLGTSLAAMNPWALGIAGAGAVAYGLYKCLSEDSIPAVQIFDDTISEGTQKAVGSFLEFNDKVTLALDQLAWSGQTVTGEMAENISGNFSQMAADIQAGLDKNYEESLGKMQNFVTGSTSLSKEEQDQILNNMQEGYENRKQSVSDGEARIKEILDTASSKKRALTKSEQEEINSIQEDMVNTGINVLSEGEVESKSIMERMKAQAGEITATQAAEVVKNSLEQKDKSIKAANEQYNDVVKEIIRQRDEAGTITKEQADKLIEEATRQRDESVKKAEEMHTNVVNEAKAQAKEHVNEVDWETGEIKTKWQIMWEDIKKYAKKAGQAFLDLAKAIPGYLKDVPSKMFNIGKDIINGLINGIKSLAHKVTETVSNVAHSISNGFKKVLGIHSPSKVFEKFGKFTVEGYVEGIEKNKYKAIKSVEDMGNMVIKQYDKLGDAVITALQNKYKEEERIQLDSLRTQTENVKRETDERLRQYDRELQAKLKVLDLETTDAEKEIQDQIDAINNKTKQEEKELKEQEYQNKITAKEKELSEAKSAEERSKIQAELNQMKAENEREHLLEHRQMQIAALQDEMDRIRQQSADKRNELQLEYEEKKKNEENKSAVVIANLENEMETTKEHYATLLEEERLQATARTIILDENNKEMIELLGSYNPYWQDAGQSFGESLLCGLNSMKQPIQEAVDDILSLVGKAGRAAANIEAQNAIIVQSKRDWEKAYETGNKAAMDKAHETAEGARKNGGTIKATDPLEKKHRSSKYDTLPKNAQGTNYFSGGWTWVGEQGPELIELPKASKVYSNQKSMDMAKGSNGGITQNITINSPTPLTPSEIARKNLQASRQLAMEWGL